MTQLDDLPSETLLNVASHIADGLRHIRYRQRDLCNLALAARKYRPIGQEELHRSVVVRTLEPPSAIGDLGSSCYPARTALLCRTLLERTDLARKVYRLQIVVWGDGSRNLNLSEDNVNTCCGHMCNQRWQDTYSLFRAHVLSEKAAWAPSHVRDAWLHSIEPGCRSNEAPLAGIILSCTTSLRHLGLVCLRNTDWWNPRVDGFHMLDNGDLDALEHCLSWVLVVQDLFGGWAPGLDFSLAAVPGFSSLISLDCTELLPWELLLCLPKLQRLRFALDTDIEYAAYVDTSSTYPDLTPRAIWPKSLRTLIVDTEIEILLAFPDHDAEERHLWFANYCLPNLPALKHLEVRIRTSWDPWEVRFDPHSFDYAFANIHHGGLETLVIDLADVKNSHRPELIEPALSLERLPKLRRVVAPQDFYFSEESNFQPCKLPPLVESIELIHTSVEIESYVQCLAGSKASYPRLRKLVFWSDTESTRQFDSLKKPWSSILEAGVELQWERGDDQGWRVE